MHDVLDLESEVAPRSALEGDAAVYGGAIVFGDTVVLDGEIDVSRVQDAERAINAAQRAHSHVLLDLRDVTLLDSSALNVIADAAHRARADGGRVSVHVTHPAVRRVLRMTFFDELVSIEPPLTARDDRDGPTVLPL